MLPATCAGFLCAGCTGDRRRFFVLSQPIDSTTLNINQGDRINGLHIDDHTDSDGDGHGDD